MMASAEPARFLFETSFDTEHFALNGRHAPPPPAAPAAETETPPPPPAPTYTEQELALARSESYAAGLDAGQRSAAATIEERTAGALARLTDQLTDLLGQQRGLDAELIGQAAEAALTMVRKILPELSRQHGVGEIEALVRSCLSEMLEEPRIVVRVADDLLDTMQARMEALTRETGFDGAIVLLADPELGPDDVKVEWADGGAERLSSRLWSEIDAAAARLCPPPTPKRRKRRAPSGKSDNPQPPAQTDPAQTD